MSPTLIKYKNISIEIYPNDHKPIHVHALVKGGYGVRVIFRLVNEKIVDVEYEDLPNKEKLTPAMKKDVKKLVAIQGDLMVKDFIRFVINKQDLEHNTIIITKL